MRIIDKNTDFYDYLQNIYRDDSIVFDRTDSFVLTKDEMRNYLDYYTTLLNDRFAFCLLQVCNAFWLFLIDVTKTDGKYGDCAKGYSVVLLEKWKNYSKQRMLINLNLISFGWTTTRFIRNRRNHNEFDISKIKDNSKVLVDAVNTNNYDIERSINEHTIYLDGWYRDEDNRRIEKHIPLLKASGLAGCIDPQEIYLSFEEYFSSEKTNSERTESIGITDKEKIENHGFDVKASFRGK